MFKIKDKKAFIFYFLMTIILTDFGNGIKKLSYVPKIQDFFDNSFVSISHVYNTGGAFSILQNQTGFLIALSVVTLCFIAFYVYKDVDFKDKIALLSLTLFSSGTLGNLIERIQNGRVVDYFKLNYFNFPVFNAFDIMICTGIFIYTIFAIFEIKTPLESPKKELDEKNCNN